MRYSKWNTVVIIGDFQAPEQSRGVMTAVIHLQNLSWSASAPDIRNFFSGFDIPNGGVRIIGGDDGDCFISFTNDRDAHHAIQKSGRYLNDQPISIRSSR